MAFKAACTFVCQQVLTEKDGVSSIIRMVELFGLAVPPGKRTERFVAYSNVVAYSFSIFLRRCGSHTVAFSITRPSGEVKTIPVFDKKVIDPARVLEADRAPPLWDK